MYDADIDGGSLLHLAANSGVLAVSFNRNIPLNKLFADIPHLCAG